MCLSSVADQMGDGACHLSSLGTVTICDNGRWVAVRLGQASVLYACSACSSRALGWRLPPLMQLQGCPQAQMSWGQPHFALGSSFLLCWGSSMGGSCLHSLWRTALAWSGDANFRPQPSRASGPPHALAQSHFMILSNPFLRKHRFTLGETMAALGYTSLIHTSAQDSIWKI